MYRDVELEARRQIISYLQDYARHIVEMCGMIIKLFDMAMESGEDKLKLLYSEVRKLDRAATELQKTITNEIIRSKPFLTNSDILYSLVTMMGDIIDSLDGAGYRAAHLSLSTMGNEYIDLLRDISSKVYEEVDAFREAIYLLGYNPAAVKNAIEKVYVLENEVDEVYRGNVAYVFTTTDDGVSILKWMEIAERLENAADYIERAADILLSLLMG